MGIQKEEKAGSIRSYGLMVMIVTHTLTHVFGGIHPAIFSLLRAEFDLSLSQLGVIAAIPPLCQALLAIPTGLLSDKFGAKKMIFISFGVAILGALLASYASNPLTFIVAISLIYINSTIYHPASYSFTAKSFGSKDRPKALGLHGAGGTLGHATGPLSVSILIGLLAFEWRQVYLLLTVPIFLGIIIVLLLKDEAIGEAVESTAMPSEDVADTKTLFTMSLVMFLVFLAVRSVGRLMISNFIVLFLQDVKGLGIAIASLVSSSTMLTGFLAAPLGGYLASRFGEKGWLLSVLAVGYLFLGLSLVIQNVILFVLFYVAYGFCNTLSMASRTSIMAKLSPSRQRGLGYSLFFLPGSIVGAVAPVMAGFLAESYGFNAIFYVALLLYIIGLGVIKFMVKVD